MNNLKPRYNSGFTFMEMVIGAATFLIVSFAAYNAFAGLFQLANASQARLLAVDLANEQFEIARNMPYNSIGIVSGIPSGTIPHIQTITRGGFIFVVTTTVRNIDLPFDGMIGSTTPDLSPADNKMYEVQVTCPTCQQQFTTIDITAEIAPKNLETASQNGALIIQVFDSNGQPVSLANVNAVDVATTAPIIINDTTNNSGVLQIIDAPTGTNAYAVTVTKPGYTTDRTYAPSVANPTPTKPHPTVLQQQVSQVSLSIDHVSTLNFASVTPTCVPVPNFHFTMTGAKQIGLNLPKYSQAMQTDGSGVLTLNNMEWDLYTITPTDASNDLAGVNPLSPIKLAPNVTQNVQLVTVPHNPRGLLVTVTDSSTFLPVSNATVHVTGPGGYDQTLTTGRGYLNQTDWSGGSGQANLLTLNKYWTDDNNIDTATSAGNIMLRKVAGSYNPNGVLESSTFDTGSASNFYTISWAPSSQPLATGPSSTMIQLATSPSSSPATWNFFGPDGTSATYYSSPGASINSVHNGDEYARYRVYLSTQSSTNTPNVSDVSFTYSSNCVPSGQVIFSSLASGSYHISVTKAGYSAGSADVNVTSNWQQQTIVLGP